MDIQYLILANFFLFLKFYLKNNLNLIYFSDQIYLKSINLPSRKDIFFRSNFILNLCL